MVSASPEQHEPVWCGAVGESGEDPGHVGILRSEAFETIGANPAEGVEQQELGRLYSGESMLPATHLGSRAIQFRLLVALAPALLLGCGDDLLRVERDAEPLIQTESLDYRLSKTSRGLLQLEIPYTFENKTGGVVFIVNCNGSHAQVLERQEAGVWSLAWWTLLPLCLDPPIEIGPGEIFSGTLHASWGAPGSNSVQTALPEDLLGVYRVRWGNALSSFSFDREGGGFGPAIPLEQRVSNPFVIRD